MTRIFGAGLAIATLAASPAFAAGFDWTRFYAGVEGGGGWGGATQTDNTPFDSGTYDVSGGLAGLTAGYDWESNHMVAGVASDFSWASIGGSTSGTPADLCGGSPSICSSELQWLGTVRGRFGYATDNVLSYLTGGAAFGSLYGREGTGPSDGFYGDGSAWRLGWTVGAGVEARINQH
jgi:outer membrane immunogenic protein